ncbi:asparaginase [Cryptosporangium aurantiacum]|uniref:Asparaginase n=1 Tax=Cryptosporangium aurantiacum TaxID=134849 RepID=A0A1M7TY37_9ACTN|nr:asparaginase [Cryptosporangium aurantiacum]SHN75563.1 asparaginase [Cryptosporangium aurantiacum]
MSDLAELAVVERDGFAESRHHGTLVALTADGRIAFAAGDPNAPILPRSSVKPWQAVVCRAVGLVLDDAGTALSAGSHTGEDAHAVLSREILVSAGLSEEALGCPPDWPEDEPTRNSLIAGGSSRSPIRMNCSGKHAAMLAASVVNGWDVGGYLLPDHPLQQRVRAILEEATGGPVTHVTTDGCGAPLFGTTTLGLARAAARLVTAAPGSAERTVADAMRAEPFFVGGTGHVNTELMRRVPGVVAKGGAEGVLVAAAADGRAVAMKVLDGSPRATTMLAVAALRALGVDTSGVGDLAEVPVLGGGRPVGRIRLGADLGTFA